MSNSIISRERPHKFDWLSPDWVCVTPRSHLVIGYHIEMSTNASTPQGTHVTWVARVLAHHRLVLIEHRSLVVGAPDAT